MSSFKLPCLALALNLMTAFLAAADASPLTVTVRPVPRPQAEGFHLGASHRPDGAAIAIDSASLRLNDQRWLPVMGEFHYTRYPAGEWRDELLKMKAAGIDIVATYVFWIHHEEIEGRFDWTGRRNLRAFVKLAGDLGFKVMVRAGPWCHGEVRNGGLPEWTLDRKDWQPRSLDPGFLQRVQILYGQIAGQLKGLLWKDGGPVIALQVDNEWSGPAEYLLTLKRIAREVGLDVPLYTRTGWPALTTPMPFGEIVPLFGSYAEGFWDRELTSMPGSYWASFRFSKQRIDENIASEQFGRRDANDAPDVARYPYFTCEICGGMINSYHRRILVDPADVESTVVVRLGSGNVLPGYYVFHGGTNPDALNTTLMEAQNTRYTNYNDLPVKDYDYQAPLGQYGQIRPTYHLLRRLHLFLHDFGARLAEMPPAFPNVVPQGKDDLKTLHWSVRSNGDSGLVFVNNYERGRSLPAHEGVQFAVELPGHTLTFPSAPVTVPPGGRFFWPFNFDLGHGVRLAWATAQPICVIDDDRVRTVFFAETDGVPARLAVAGEAAVHTVAPGRGVALRLAGADGGEIRIVVLSPADSLAIWKGEWLGRERVFFTQAALVLDGATLRLSSQNVAELQVGVLPAPDSLAGGKSDGLFTRFMPPAPRTVRFDVSFSEVQPAGPARNIRLGNASDPVAEQPADAEFSAAAVWRVTLPRDLDLSVDPVLRIHYVGDVARVTLNGRLLTDDFYNGNGWEVGLRRHAPEILDGDLRIAILPLRRDAVTGAARKIYLADGQLPDFGTAASIATLQSIEIVPRYQVELTSP